MLQKTNDGEVQPLVQPQDFSSISSTCPKLLVQLLDSTNFPYSSFSIFNIQQKMKAGNTIVDHLSSCIFCNGIYTEMEVPLRSLPTERTRLGNLRSCRATPTHTPRHTCLFLQQQLFGYKVISIIHHQLNTFRGNNKYHQIRYVRLTKEIIHVCLVYSRWFLHCCKVDNTDVDGSCM